MLATPVQTMKIPPPTRASSPIRSTTSLGRRNGGTDSRRGQTSQSLATSTGTEAIPAATWRPWVKRNRPAGRAGTGNQLIGCWWAWENRPVTKQIVKRRPRAAPSQAARRSSRKRALVGVLAQREVGVGREPLPAAQAPAWKAPPGRPRWAKQRPSADDAIEPEEAEPGRPGELGDGVGADDRPAEPRPPGPAPLEPSPVGPPAADRAGRGLDLDDARCRRRPAVRRSGAAAAPGPRRCRCSRRRGARCATGPDRAAGRRPTSGGRALPGCGTAPRPPGRGRRRAPRFPVAPGR